MSADQISAVRKRIRELHDEMGRLLEGFLKRAPLLKGCVYESRHRCGKSGCACARGALHVATVLAYRGQGKQRNRHPAGRELVLVRQMTSDYQRFRRARARLVKAFQELLGQVALLERERVAEGERRFRTTDTGRCLR